MERSALAVAQYGGRILHLHAVAAGRVNGMLRGLSDDEIRAREAELHAQLRLLAEEVPRTEAVSVTDRRGVVLVGGPVVDPGDVLPLAAADASRFHVSRPYRAAADGELAFAISRRREQSGNDAPPGGFDGLVRVAILPGHLARDLAGLTLGRGDIAGLVRSDGEILARSAGLAAPARVPDALAAALADGPPTARLQARSVFDGSPHLVAARRIEGWPVYAVGIRPRAEIVAAWRRALVHQLAIGLPATFLLVGLAFTVRQGGRRLGEAKDLLEQRVAARTAELAESEQRLRRALRAGRVVALEYDAAAGRVFRSPNAAEVLGLPEEAATRQSHAASIANLHPEDRGRALATVAALTPERPGFTLRVRHLRPDGGTVWLLTQGAATFAPDGRLLHVSSLARDITAETKAEAARQEAELRLRAATEGAGLGTYEIDFARGIAWFDARAAALAGGILPAAAWFRLDAGDWAALLAAVHPEDRAAFDKAWSDSLAGRTKGWAVECRIGRAGGGWSWNWCHGTVLECDPATGRPRRLVGIVQDITGRRELEAELRQGQKLQALGTLAGGIAHDFNNVLQAVSGAAAMIRREPADPALVERRAGMLAEAVRRGAAITGRLLAFARRNEGRAEPLDPVELLQGLKEMLAPALGTAIEIRLAVGPGLPPLLAEREQLQTALINLASNARDAMPAGGTITLSAQAVEVASGGEGGPAGLAPGRYLRLAVRDTGEGMDAATLARAADPFFTTKPAGLGTGLGLPMAKGLARQAGGGFAITSEQGRGTTVTLWLPQALLPATRPGDEAPDAADDPPMRILLVDDDALVRESLAEQLRAAGHATLTAESASQASALLEGGAAVDALVADLVMPGPSGLSLIAEARRRRPGLPAVLLTGTPGEDIPGGAAVRGAFKVLRKPAGAGEVIAGLAAQLKAAPAPA